MQGYPRVREIGQQSLVQLILEFVLQAERAGLCDCTLVWLGLPNPFSSSE